MRRLGASVSASSVGLNVSAETKGRTTLVWRQRRPVWSLSYAARSDMVALAQPRWRGCSRGHYRRLRSSPSSVASGDADVLARAEQGCRRDRHLGVGN